VDIPPANAEVRQFTVRKLLEFLHGDAVAHPFLKLFSDKFDQHDFSSLIAAKVPITSAASQYGDDPA
jgi:hypothetical protein